MLPLEAAVALCSSGAIRGVGGPCHLACISIEAQVDESKGRDYVEHYV